jgi:hypothetical protein
MSIIFTKDDVRLIVFNILQNEKNNEVKYEVANRVISALVGSDSGTDEISILSSPESIARETIFEYQNISNN